MAILTLAEFKASATYLLNTAKYPTDAITSQLVLDSEDSYLSVRNRPFKKITGSYENGVALITGISEYDMVGLDKGQRVGGTSIRGEVIDVDIDNNQITIDANSSAAVDDDEMFIYPEQSLNTAIKIVNYLRSAYTTDQSKKSESIEKHSWSMWGQTDLQSGLPVSITASIKRLARVKEGQKTGAGYYKGRQEISATDIDTKIVDGDITVTE